MTGRQRAVALAIAALVAVVALWRLMGSVSEEGDSATEVAVHVAEVSQATLHRYVTAYGTVEPRPALEGQPAGGALISFFLDGVLASVDVAEGQRVEAGAVLFRLDDRLARIAVEGARAQATFAEEAFRRQEQLLSTDGTSQRAYQEALRQRDGARAELDAAETALGYMSVTAPLAGVVSRITARPGQRVDAGTVLAHVVNLDRLVVAAGVPAAEITGVAVGQPARLGSGADGPRGAVVAVGRDVDPATGTYRVLVSVPQGSGLMPGEFTEAHIEAETRADVFVVPEAALVTAGDEGSWVMVVRGDQATRLPVVPGLRDGGLVEISGDGVGAGLSVVTVEAYSLPEETRVRVAGN